MAVKYEINDEARETIEKLFEILSETCAINKVPMYATVVLQDRDDKTEYKSIVYNAVSHGIRLSDDRIRKHMLIADGFEPVMPREVVTFDPFGVLDNE